MPGFDFSNYNRNAALHARGVPLPKATSTGTTIVGCIYAGGVVVSWPVSWDAMGTYQSKFTTYRSPPTHEQPRARSSPTRTARSCTTLLPTSGARAPVPPPTPSSPPP
jgi:hypothetical protein